MSATLRMTRGLGFGIELRRGRFVITVDGKSVDPIEYRQTIETSLEPGRHTLRIRNGRYSSRDHSFDVADGEVVNFRCHGAGIWPIYVASIVRPDLAISLKREETARPSRSVWRRVPMPIIGTTLSVRRDH